MGLSDSSFNLNDIAIFVEVAKRKSISRTAESFSVPATTLSRRLRALEARLGVELLARSTRHIALTEAGKLYYERCRLLVEQAFDAHDVLQEQGVKPKGTLKVLLPDPLDALRFASVVHSFGKDWPDLDCRYDYLSGRNWDADRDFDVALRWGAQPDSDLVARCLLFVPFRLYASRDYLALHGRPSEPQELDTHECLGTNACRELSSWVLMREKAHATITPKARLRSNDLEIVRRFAHAGAGIAALPAVASANSGLEPVLPEWVLGPVAIYALFGSRTPPARARAFVDFLMERLPASLGRLQTSNNPDSNDWYASRLGQRVVSKVDAWTFNA